METFFLLDVLYRSLEQQTALLLEIQNLQTLHPGWVDVAPEGRLALQLGSFVFRYDKPMGIQAITPRPLLQGYTAPNWVQNCIVNVYDGKSDCIKPHIDSLWFGEHVEILSLGSPCKSLQRGVPIQPSDFDIFFRHNAI